MIEIVHPYKKVWSMFTLASLLPDKEEVRIHLYVNNKDWDEAPIDWIVDNFPNVKIYESFWRKSDLAKCMCHLMDHWKDKGGLHKRIVWLGGNNIINGKWSNNFPNEEFFAGSVSFLSHKRVFRKHPRFKDFYRILQIPISPTKLHNIDPEFMIFNYDMLKTFSLEELFCPTEKDGLESRSPNMPKIDRLLYQASTEWFMTRLLGYQHKFMPIYMNGKNDILIELEALGPLDSVNYNVMLRKSFQLNIQHKWLLQTYTMLPTTIQLSIPWDMYTNLIPSIPINMRNARNNELLMLKSTKQKRVAGSLVKVGFRLGKI